MTRIYLVMVSDGRESSVVLACTDEATAIELAARASGHVEDVILIDPEAE